MTVPTDTKDRVIYHTILSDMHRAHAMTLSLQTLDDPLTAESLREHFTREQSLALGKLSEWRKHRSDVYQQASEDFQTQK